MTSCGSSLAHLGAPAYAGNADACWYAVWTHSQCEGAVETRLRQKSFETFLPRITMPSRRRDRRKMLSVPLFPGYLFLHFAPTKRDYLEVANTDGVVRILGDGWQYLVPIPDEQLDAIHRIATAGKGVRPVPWMKIGDRVRIVAGALAELEGLVRDWRASRATFVLSVDLLQRSVAVEVPAGAVARI